jgi:Fe-S cluster assembly protein SufD
LAELKRASRVQAEAEMEKQGRGITLVTAGVRPRAGEPRWLTELRARAMDRYERMSWPTPREEEWRRTDVTEIDFERFSAPAVEERVEDSAGVPCAPEAARTAERPGMAGSVRFESGSCTELALSPELLRRGVRLVPLSEWGKESGIPEQALQSALEEGFRALDNRFQAWHYSALSHGVYLYVPPFVEIAEPFLFELEEGVEGPVGAPHLAVVLDRGARAKVIVRTVGAATYDTAAGDDGAIWPQAAAEEADLLEPAERARTPQERFRSLVNLGVDLVVGEAAGLDYYNLQDLPTSSLLFAHGAARVARDGHLLTFEAALGSGLLKSRLDCSLDGAGAEAFLHGIYLSRERQHMDIRTVQRHRAPNAASRAFYKGALKDRSRSIYQGLIEVTPVASKTDAFLTDRNLILNDGARADSIPSLRIDTNDVKCSHGSTTGKIDEAQVFYLMSRGLSRSDAEQMLILGYFEELLAPAPERFAAELRGLVGRRIAGNGYITGTGNAGG